MVKGMCFLAIKPLCRSTVESLIRLRILECLIGIKQKFLVKVRIIYNLCDRVPGSMSYSNWNIKKRN